jgi:prephenate dehydrogenase
MINSIGIIGYGKLGSFLHELGKQHFHNMDIRVHSRRHEEDGETFFDLKTTAQSDLVFLCASIDEYQERMRDVLEHAPPETIFIDVAAVKKYTSELCQKYCQGRRYISTHPLFGPESYKKYHNKIDGFQIVVTDYALKNDTYQMIKAKFSALGFSIIEMSADEHDRQLAETLFLTHYIGKTITKAGFSSADVKPLSFQYLIDAIESVKDDEKLFKNIYRYNPYCKEVIDKFHVAQEQVEGQL